jgi:hypothetical protein
MRHVPVTWILGLLLAAGGAPAAPQASKPGTAQDQPTPAAAGAAAATAAEWSPQTGDTWVDAVLADINAYGRRYPDAFVDELERYRGAPRDYVAGLLADPAWTPGDVYFACALAQAIGRSCRYVAGERQAHAGEGWGTVAKGLGIAPGSAEFRALKDGFAAAYGRWSRPLPPADAGKAHKPANGKAHGRGKASRKPAERK